MKKIIQKIILAGIVFYKGKVLIIQRSDKDDAYPGLWELPSGKREFLEKSRETLKREVKEETGINVKPTMPVSVFEFKVEKKNEIRDATQISFLVKPIGKPTIKLSHEHQDYAWVTESELDRYKLSDETKKAILKVFKLLSESLRK